MAGVASELGHLVTSTGVTTVYGEQQDVDGIRVIPVALVGYGFGGGEGEASEQGSGNGGGGGGFAAPLGAYVRRGDDIRFEPNVIALLVAAVPFVCVAGRAFSRIIRALRKRR